MIIAGFALFEAVLAFFQFPGTGVGFAMALMPAFILWYLSTDEVAEAFAPTSHRRRSDPRDASSLELTTLAESRALRGRSRPASPTSGCGRRPDDHQPGAGHDGHDLLADARGADAIVLAPDDERRRRDGRQLVAPVVAQDLGGRPGHPSGAGTKHVAQEGREDRQRCPRQRPQGTGDPMPPGWVE